MQPKFIEPIANRKPGRKVPGTLIALIVGIVLVIIAGVGLLIMNTNASPVSNMDRLNARMAALSSYVTEARKSARNPDLAKINSDTSIILSGDIGAIKSATASAGAKGATKDVIAAEKQASTKLLTQLQKAALDGRFDREYLTVMSEQLQSTQTLLREVNEKSSSAKVKTATKSAYDHLSTILKSLDALAL